MALLVYFVLFLALTGHSSALYCLCKDGVGDQILQKAIDYACANGADCTQIQQNGPCYLPNTVKDHCSFAVNSYYQKKQNAGGTCDFSGAATTSSTAPTTTSGCVYPSSSSTTPSTGTPGIAPPTGTTPGTGTGTGTGTETGTGTGSPNIFGISPTSTTGTGGINGSGAHLEGTNAKLLLPLGLAVWLALRV